MVVEGEKNGENFVKYSSINVVYDTELPKEMLESLKEEISAGLDYYREGVSRSLWNRGPALLSDKQRTKLDELIKVAISEDETDVAETSTIEGVVGYVAPVALQDEVELDDDSKDVGGEPMPEKETK